MAAKKKVNKKENKEIDIFEHELVPKHRVLNIKETWELLKKYGIKSKQLPRILAKDPAVKAIDAKPGDIIEITRKSPTAGEAKYYRVVVSEKS